MKVGFSSKITNLFFSRSNYARIQYLYEIKKKFRLVHCMRNLTQICWGPLTVPANTKSNCFQLFNSQRQKIIKWNVLPGHGWTLQAADSRESPIQGPEPQVLCLICIPPPQVLSQGENRPHGLHVPKLIQKFIFGVIYIVQN